MNTVIKKRAIHRIKILQGQLKGIERMISADEYCVDIITQSLAVQKSIGSLNKLILENHLRTHVTDMIKSDHPDTVDKAVVELLSLYELNNVRS